MRSLSSRRLLAVSRTEWLHLRRDPRSLGVIVIQPVVLLILYGYAINFDLKDVTVAVYDQDRSAASRSLIRDLESSTYFHVTRRLDSRAEVAPLLAAGRVRLVVVVPPDFARDLAAGKPGNLQLLLDGADSNTATIAKAYSDGLLSLHARRLLTRAVRRRGVPELWPGITPEPRILYNEALESTAFMAPGLIAIVLAMLSALLTAGTVVRERENGTLEQLVASPLRAQELLLGKLLPYLLVSLANTLTVIGAAWLLFHLWPAGSFWLLLLLVLVALPTMLGLGLFFSLVVNTQQLALIAAFLTTVLPSLLLSGFAFPIQNMPRPLQVVALFVPATHLLKILRGIYLKGVGLSVLWPQALILAAFSFIVMWLCVRRYRPYLE